MSLYETVLKNKDASAQELAQAVAAMIESGADAAVLLLKIIHGRAEFGNAFKQHGAVEIAGHQIIQNFPLFFVNRQ